MVTALHLILDTREPSMRQNSYDVMTLHDIMCVYAYVYLSLSIYLYIYIIYVYIFSPKTLSWVRPAMRTVRDLANLLPLKLQVSVQPGACQAGK